MAVVGIAGNTHCSRQPATLARHRHADLLAKLVLLARLALGEAHHLWLVHAVNLRLILPLLSVYPFVEGQKPGESLGSALPLHLPDHPTQIRPQVARARLRPPHLPGVGIAAPPPHQVPAHPRVALLDRQSGLPPVHHQALPRPVVQAGILRVADRLGLHGDIKVHATRLGARDHLHRHARLDRRLQHSLRPGFTQSLAPPRHARRINRPLVLKKLPAAELLPVGILHPARHHRLVAHVVLILQVMQQPPSAAF